MMAWLRQRPLTAALLCALCLRLGLAIATEINPLFPPHYYNDSHDIDTSAMRLLSRDRGGDPYIDIPPGSIIYTTLTHRVYRNFGFHPVIMKLLNTAIAVTAIATWYAAARLAVGTPAALLLAWVLTLWPSSIFYGSQHMRDASIQLLTGCAFWICLTALYGDSRGRRWLHWTLGAIPVLYLLGLYRPHSLLFTSVALLAACTARLFRGKGPILRATALAAALILTMVVFQTTSRKLLYSIQPPPPQTNTSVLDASLLPTVVDPGRPTAPIYTPQGLSEFRRYRHYHENRWATYKTGRDVKTQVLSDVEFDSWLDVALFLPKGVFYALFMPLPGLYPLEGKLGRILAAGENLMLLVFLTGCLPALHRWRQWHQAGGLLVFFLINALAYGIFEFDLGSATRHRLQYFPAILPFAALFWLEQWPKLRGWLNSEAHS
jgi:hypothetical protein